MFGAFPDSNLYHKLTLFSKVWLIFPHLGKVSPSMTGLLLPGSGYGSCLSFPFIYKSLSPLRSLVHQGFLCPPLLASFIETYYFILLVFLLLTIGIRSSVPKEVSPEYSLEGLPPAVSAPTGPWPPHTVPEARTVCSWPTQPFLVQSTL